VRFKEKLAPDLAKMAVSSPLNIAANHAASEPLAQPAKTDSASPIEIWANGDTRPYKEWSIAKSASWQRFTALGEIVSPRQKTRLLFVWAVSADTIVSPFRFLQAPVFSPLQVGVGVGYDYEDSCLIHRTLLIDQLVYSNYTS
jgi:hypothetical protein